MNRPTPTLAEPIRVAEFWKNRRSESVRISLSTYKERNLIDGIGGARPNVAEGRLKPTTKGIATKVCYRPKLVAALAKAESKARELGLITSDNDRGDR